ncbi:MAG TPA: CPBP family intramembrane glutamic endopeptidase [Steroidobacteraceae bacterium]|nr:CPBP family intramembrane glutamic endopeptidase [Steroidobacteraceae bacterium]
MSDTAPIPRLRVGILIWSAGTLGAVTVAIGVLPQLSAKMPLPAPLWLITLASVFQSALLVALAVWSGTALAPAVGLRAPAFEAAATRQPVMPALKPQILPGFAAGVLGGFLLFASLGLSPAAIAALQDQFTPPLYARMLYGGITEEVLLRWGLMAAFTWLAWRFFQGKRGAVHPALTWLAIAVSALLFGVGHLPVASYLIGSLNPSVVLFVVGLNATFGLLFGWLFWRRGLESAMIAHAITHFVSYWATELSGVLGAA